MLNEYSIPYHHDIRLYNYMESLMAKTSKNRNMFLGDAGGSHMSSGRNRHERVIRRICLRAFLRINGFSARSAITDDFHGVLYGFSMIECNFLEIQ